MKFEILLSTYNGSKYIKEQLDSIIDQSYCNWEILIADDKSIDKTLDIIKTYAKKDKRISFYENEKKLGPLISFSNLIKKSNEEYIIFCDQDDIWSRNKLEIIHKYIVNSNKNIIFGMHNAKYLLSDKKHTRRINKTEIINNEAVYKRKPNLSFLNLLKSNKVIGCMTFGKSQSLKKIVDKNLPKNSDVYLDYWLALNMSLKSNIEFIDEYLIQYRRHDDIATMSGRFILEKIKMRFIIIAYLFLNLLSR